MEYQIKRNCKRVVLNILAGSDESLVGLTLYNCNIISMSMDDFVALVVQVNGIMEYNHLISCLAEHGVYKGGDGKLVVLESIEESEDSGIHEFNLCDALRLYKAEDVFSCYRISYRWDGEKIIHGGIVKLIKYTHAIDHLPARYYMTETEKTEFPEWYENCFQKLKHKSMNPKFKNALQAYYTSYMVGIVDLEYIMLFSALEMIFGSGHSEITYQISRGTALLLSADSRSMTDVYRKMKKLYTVRSKYVHGGERVPLENLYELRDIVRRILIRLTELQFYTLDSTFEMLRERILTGGFHCFDKEGED